MNAPQIPGRVEAHRLAFACFVQNIGAEEFDGLPLDQQVEFAELHARLDRKQLASAFRYLSDYAARCAQALEDSRRSHLSVVP